jgi:trehalose 2-sulfotransferase
MAKYESYVLCTSPRSGSTLLCKLLAATGVAGNPDSYFHRPAVSEWLADLNLTPESALSEREVLSAIFKAAMSEGSLDTGMFGLRLQRHSFDFFTQKLAVLHPGLSTDTRRFAAAFGRTRFIHLTRQDKVEQAVSYVKAQQTGLWHRSPDGTELERLSPPEPPVYDAVRIGQIVDEMTAHDRDWENWLAAEAVDPLRLTYEGLSEDPVSELTYVLNDLGVNSDAAHEVKPGVKKLADETNADWVARFRSEQPA